MALHNDVAGAAANGRLTANEASFARGPDATAGTNLALIRAALARIPRSAPFSIVRGGRWGSAKHPNRRTLFVWEAGESWTQYVLAPRIEVPRPPPRGCSSATPRPRRSGSSTRGPRGDSARTGS